MKEDETITSAIEKSKEIPDRVMAQLIQNRENILNDQFEQEKKKRINQKKVTIGIITVAAVISLVISHPYLSSAIKKTLGIASDLGVSYVEDNAIEHQLNLSSEQNGREIKITKFISTEKRIAFDYQFEINNQELAVLLAKKEERQKNGQLINFGIFAEGSDQNLVNGSTTYSTFYVEGNTFYGSVITTFMSERISNEDQLVLHIYDFVWEDEEEIERLLKENDATGNSFHVSKELTYKGDWVFNIDYKPLAQTSKPQISNVKNITNIKAKSDALQTTVKFTIPIQKMDEAYLIEFYQNGKKVTNQNATEIWDASTGEFELSFSLSCLDKTTEYTVKVNKVDSISGKEHQATEVSSFTIKN